LWQKLLIGFGLGRLWLGISEHSDHHALSMEITVLCKWLPAADADCVGLFVILSTSISRITVEK
jgi:hypothetical protein